MINKCICFSFFSDLNNLRCLLLWVFCLWAFCSQLCPWPSQRWPIHKSPQLWNQKTKKCKMNSLRSRYGNEWVSLVFGYEVVIISSVITIHDHGTPSSVWVEGSAERGVPTQGRPTSSGTCTGIVRILATFNSPAVHSCTYFCSLHKSTKLI